jgi:TldD protein
LRDTLRGGALAAVTLALPRQLRARGIAVHPGIPVVMSYDTGLVDTDTMRALVSRAIDAAKSAGATYADARITRTVTQTYSGASLQFDTELLALGVRALVNGAWGFAASPYWTETEAVALARGAVAQATVNAAASAHPVELGHYPVANGSWSTPIRIDPFQIPLEEKTDFIRSFEDDFELQRRYGRLINGGPSLVAFERQERAVATSEGAYFVQTLYKAGMRCDITMQNTDWRRPASAPDVASAGLDLPTFAGGGWERVLDARFHDHIPRLIELADEQLSLPHKPVSIGRYDLVCTGRTMASLVAATLGAATELDRALGYEANAGGTSYLGPNPLARLGQTTLGTSLLTVTGDRSMEGGLATVKWDDEGVEPETFPIIQHGALADYQTTREQAEWLASWYTAQHRPVRSHGCAGAESALSIPMQFTPNLTLAPGTSDVGLDALIAGTTRGLLLDGAVASDFQSRSGTGGGMFREIVNGKLGAVVDGAGLLFDSTQVWKGLKALGGPSSRATLDVVGVKGQPSQAYQYSVSAVPGVIANAAIVDLTKPL